MRCMFSPIENVVSVFEKAVYSINRALKQTNRRDNEIQTAWGLPPAGTTPGRATREVVEVF